MSRRTATAWLASGLVAVMAIATGIVLTRDSVTEVSRTVPFRYIPATQRQFTLEYETSAAASPALDGCTAADLRVNAVRRAFETELGLQAKPGGRACALPALAPVTLVAPNGERLTPVNDLNPNYHAKIALRPGQYALYTVHWDYNCDPAFEWGATARLQLPGGVLTWNGIPTPDRCLRHTHDPPLTLGGWRPVHPPSQVPWERLRVQLQDVPSTIAPGQTVRFTAVLENPDDGAVVLAPCPAFSIAVSAGLDHVDD